MNQHHPNTEIPAPALTRGGTLVGPVKRGKLAPSPWVEVPRAQAAAANQQAMGMETLGERSGWTFDLHSAAIALHGRASGAYTAATRGAGASAPDGDFLRRQATAHQAAMERHAVSLNDLVAPALRSARRAEKDEAAAKLDNARAALRTQLPVWLTPSLGAPVVGAWVKLTVKPNGSLQVCLTAAGRECVGEWREENPDRSLANLTVDLVGSNEMGWVSREEAGAFTDAPILALGPVGRDDRGELSGVSSLYWHERYRLDDPIRQLLTAGEVIFDGARLDLSPELDDHA